jgi:hypothetical protein
VPTPRAAKRGQVQVTSATFETGPRQRGSPGALSCPRMYHDGAIAGPVLRVALWLPVWCHLRDGGLTCGSRPGESYDDLKLITSGNVSADGIAGICRRFGKQDYRIRHSRSTDLTEGRSFVIEQAGGMYLFTWNFHRPRCGRLTSGPDWAYTRGSYPEPTERAFPTVRDRCANIKWRRAFLLRHNHAVSIRVTADCQEVRSR